MTPDCRKLIQFSRSSRSRIVSSPRPPSGAEIASASKEEPPARAAIINKFNYPPTITTQKLPTAATTTTTTTTSHQEQQQQHQASSGTHRPRRQLSVLAAPVDNNIIIIDNYLNPSDEPKGAVYCGKRACGGSQSDSCTLATTTSPTIPTTSTTRSPNESNDAPSARARTLISSLVGLNQQQQQQPPPPLVDQIDNPAGAHQHQRPASGPNQDSKSRIHIPNSCELSPISSAYSSSSIDDDDDIRDHEEEEDDDEDEDCGLTSKFNYFFTPGERLRLLSSSFCSSSAASSESAAAVAVAVAVAAAQAAAPLADASGGPTGEPPVAAPVKPELGGGDRDGSRPAAPLEEEATTTTATTTACEQPPQPVASFQAITQFAQLDPSNLSEIIGAQQQQQQQQQVFVGAEMPTTYQQGEAIIPRKQILQSQHQTPTSRRPIGPSMPPIQARMQTQTIGHEQRCVRHENHRYQAATTISEQQLLCFHLMPKTYPNNTLLEDLSKCHRDLTQLWPQPSRLTWTLIRLVKSCWWPPGLISKCTSNTNNEINKTTTTTTISATSRSSQDNSNKLDKSLKVAQGQEQPAPNSIQRKSSLAAASGGSESLGTKQTNRRRRPRRHRGPRRAKISYHMPESLLRTNPTLNAHDYNQALRVLTSDIRFKLHLLLYRRLQTIWLLFSTLICILLPTLFVAQLELTLLAAICAGWLGLQLVGALVTYKTKKKLDQMLEKSVAQVNSYFMDHNLMLGVINVGSLLTKTRLLIPMLYFDTSQCREQIESIISIDLRQDDADDSSDNKQHPKQQQHHHQEPALDYSKIGLPLTKPNVMALAQSQLAKKIVLRYSQRWISYFDKRKLMFNDDGVDKPRHLSTGKCLCQFIEEHFRNTNRQQIRDELTDNDTAARGEQQPATTTTPGEVVAVSGGGGGGERPPAAPMQATAIEMDDDEDDGDRDMSTDDDDDGGDGDDEVNSGSGRRCPKSLEANDRRLARAVPTLSHIVDMKEQDYNNNHHDLLGDTNNERTNSTSPVTDFSLELDTGDFLNNDDLIRKLRFILELKKNDSSRPFHMANRFDTLQYPATCNGMNLFNKDTTTTTTRTTVTKQTTTNNSNSNSNHKMGGAKNKFFSQNDGLFFFNTKKSQQQQQQQQVATGEMKQILEIC